MFCPACVNDFGAFAGLPHTIRRAMEDTKLFLPLIELSYARRDLLNGFPVAV